MSDLFKLKKWLTLENAAKHLSSIFNEIVNDYDILRFALDGHLILSTNIINGADAKKYRLCTLENVPKYEMPFNGELKILALPMSDGTFLEKEDKVICINGIYDLVMLGNERLDIEQECQMLTKGFKVELVCVEGTYLKHPETEIMYELQDHFKDDSESMKDERNYYPAGGLPKDSVLVVRTDAILKFVELSKGKKLSKPSVKFMEVRNKIGNQLYLNCFEISFWLRLDFWTKEQAALLFCNIVPDTFIKDKSGNETFFEFNGGYYSLDGHGDEGVDGFYDRYCVYEYCLRLIDGKDHYLKSPNEWIERAISKNITANWFDFAISEGFYIPKKNEAISKQDVNKPLTMIERETLLIIIAALAQEAKIDYKKPSKAGELIANLTQIIGAPISPTTIERHLKQITQALENRAK